MTGVIERLKGGLIVSCQALPHEPLHGAGHMAAMAAAALEGGAAGVRANSPQDIRAIRARVAVPIIGLHKVEYADSPVYITPTIREVAGIVDAGADIVAVDATERLRPGGQTLKQFFAEAKARFPGMLFMADVSTYEEGIAAIGMGFDLISTTMSGYTPHSAQRQEPDLELVGKLAAAAAGAAPIVAEGRIETPDQLREAFELGAFAAVVGSAITRPQLIARRFVSAIPDSAGRKP